MNLFKRIILFCLIINITSYGLDASGQEHQSYHAKSYGLLKNTVKISSALGAALLAHIVTELPIIVAHEYGHYFGNSITGGKGGSISVECNLHKHPLAALMPFFATWGSPEENGNQTVCSASGPLVGLVANYAVMGGVNSAYARQNRASREEALKAGLRAPWDAYKKVSNKIAQLIIKNDTHNVPSFSEIFLITFNLLKSSKMFGEFLYGLTPISIHGGDGQLLWSHLGFQKDCTVSEYAGLGLAITPIIVAIAFGVAKGINLRLNEKQNIEKSVKPLKLGSNSKIVDCRVRRTSCFVKTTKDRFSEAWVRRHSFFNPL